MNAASKSTAPQSSASKSTGGLLRDFGANLVSRYGSKGLDFVVLAVVTRLVSMELVGVVFVSEAAGAVAFRVLDLGLYPVLLRRAARGRVGARLLARGQLLRAVTAAGLTAGYAAVAVTQAPEHAGLAIVFFALAGVRAVHEVPRATLAGAGGFTSLAKIALGTKALELAVTGPAAALGAGVWGWALGRGASQLTMLLATARLARAKIPADAPSGSLRGLVREGGAFWLATLLASGSAQLDVLILGATGGLSQTAELGIATKIVGGSLSIVGALTLAAFPRLARQRDRFITRRQALGVAGLAITLGGGVALAAPVASLILVGEIRAELVETIRFMCPVIALAAVARPLEVWLQAKDREASLVFLALAVGVTSAVSFALWVPAYGANGAAWARVLRAAVQLLGAAALAYVAVQAPRAPLAFAIAKLPFGRALLERLLARRVRRLTEGLAARPDVRAVEISGSAGEPRRFVMGKSDVDLIVATVGAPPPRLVSRAPLADRLFPTHALCLDAALFHAARRLGHPLLSIDVARPTYGTRVNPEVSEADRRASALGHAVSRALRLQRNTLAQARADGSARADATLESFRWFARYVPRSLEEIVTDVRARGLPLPPEAAGRARVRGWLTPEQTAAALTASLWELRRAYAAEPAPTEVVMREPASEPLGWLDDAEARGAARGRAARALFGPSSSLLLSPTGPTDDDPLLAVGLAEDPPLEAVLAFMRAELAQAPLPPPFRAYPCVHLLPHAALERDPLIEHAPLFHTARAAHGRDLEGLTPRAPRPPDAALSRAALRSIVHALVWLDRDLARLARGDLDRRARALLFARLPALSLWMDGVDPGATRAEVIARYTRLRDDPLAALLASGEADPASARRALRAWREERTAQLDDVPPLDDPSAQARSSQ